MLKRLNQSQFFFSIDKAICIQTVFSTLTCLQLNSIKIGEECCTLRYSALQGLREDL